MRELPMAAHAKGKGLDLVEICGGGARASQVAVRRRLNTLPHFDLVTLVDLTLPHHQQDTQALIHATYALVVIMAPVCGPF